MTGAAIVAMGAIVLSGCASERDGGGTDEESSDVDSTFVFGASNDPSGLDPALRTTTPTSRSAQAARARARRAPSPSASR